MSSQAPFLCQENKEILKRMFCVLEPWTSPLLNCTPPGPYDSSSPSCAQARTNFCHLLLPNSVVLSDNVCRFQTVLSIFLLLFLYCCSFQILGERLLPANISPSCLEDGDMQEEVKKSNLPPRD